MAAMSVRFRRYRDEADYVEMDRIFAHTLSEPYNFWTYRYFTEESKDFSYLAYIGKECVGAVMSKIEADIEGSKSGYIGMVAVDPKHRRNGIATRLVRMVIDALTRAGAKEIVLETEIHNVQAVTFYQRLGFISVMELPRNYISGSSAYRMKYWPCDNANVVELFKL